MNSGSSRKSCTPAVSRDWLWLVAGLVWSGVGIILCILAVSWFAHMDWPASVSGALTGFGIGVAVYKYGFSLIANKNIDRIALKPDKVCFFAFQAWRSYILILIMMVLGYALRHSPLPRMIIATIYLAVGTALALSSSLYYDKFL